MVILSLTRRNAHKTNEACIVLDKRRQTSSFRHVAPPERTPGYIVTALAVLTPLGYLAAASIPPSRLGTDAQSYIRKGIWRQGIGSFVRKAYVSTLCPVVVCPYLCTSETRSRTSMSAVGASVGRRRVRFRVTKACLPAPEAATSCNDRTLCTPRKWCDHWDSHCIWRRSVPWTCALRASRATRAPRADVARYLYPVVHRGLFFRPWFLSLLWGLVCTAKSHSFDMLVLEGPIFRTLGSKN